MHLATLNLPKSFTFLRNFCKGVKIYHFSSKIIFGQFLLIFGDFCLVTLTGSTLYLLLAKNLTDRSFQNSRWRHHLGTWQQMTINLHSVTCYEDLTYPSLTCFPTCFSKYGPTPASFLLIFVFCNSMSNIGKVSSEQSVPKAEHR